MDDKPRYSRITDLISLLILMMSKFNGVSLDEIQEYCNVSRRTAERMRDCLLDALPQIEEIETNERCKRWGFTNYSLNELVHFSDDNIVALENLKQSCNRVSWAELDDIITKLKVLKFKRHSKIDESNIELILQTEGFAVRQTQNYKIDLVNISLIRNAIRARNKISAKYHDKERILEPLGLIFGEKVHLIAREKEKGDEEYNYIFHKLQDVKVLPEMFEPMGFDLQEYAKQSFGVYFGEIFDVKLKFVLEAAEDVLNYNFHPTQKIKQQPDGSIIVTFKASGDKHIMWNLFKWGPAVEILAPTSLKKKYKEYIAEINKKL